jgi:CRISPR/Cas system-associated exonuclease Cas4 (RecB family)
LRQPKKPASQRDYLSYSALRTYAGCPLRYFFAYVLGLPESTVAANLLLGIGIHAALEAHFRAMLVGETVSLDELLGVFWEAWEGRRAPAIRYGRGEDLSVIGSVAERMLRAFLVSDAATVKGKVIGVEEELRGPVFGDLPDLLARLDLIVDAGDYVQVTDFKSSRSQWDQDQVISSADQLLLYSELAHSLANGRPVHLEFVVLTKTKVPSVTRHPVAYDPRQVERTKRVVERIWRAIQGGHFYPAPSPMQCPSCPFRAPCAQWKG